MTIHVSIPRQILQIRQGTPVLWEAPVSTSQFGVGEEEGSFRTPRGKFTIAEKIGAGAPFGAVFKARVPTGEIWAPGTRLEADLILTRILWLEGAEAHNANTRARYIYFHGTNHEDKIGTPASHGCIRLRNEDMITLFDYAHPGMAVEIQDS